MCAHNEGIKKIVMVSFLHVDDTMQCGKKKAISKFKTKVTEQFSIKELGQLRKHRNLVFLEDRSGLCVISLCLKGHKQIHTSSVSGSS